MSLAGRSALALVLSVVAITRLAPGDAASLFQALVLQAVIAVAFSGAGFVRGVTAGIGRSGIAVLVGYSLNIIAWSLVLITLALVVPQQWIASLPTGSPILLVVLVLGAGAAAITPVMQGMLAGIGSAKAAYGPTILAALAGVVALVMLPNASISQMLGIWVATQFGGAAATFVAVWFSSTEASSNSDVSDEPDSSRFGHASNSLVFGSINALNMLAIFVYREHWEAAVPATVAATVFFILRLSDTWIQLLFYVLATRDTNSLIKRIIARASRFSQALYFLAFAAVSLAIVSFDSAFAKVSASVICVAVFQIAADIFRVQSSITSIEVLKLDRPVAYGVIALLPTFAGVCLAWVALPVVGWTAIYVLQISMAGLQVLICLALIARWDMSRATDHDSLR